MIIKNGKRLDGFCVDSLPIGTLQPYLGLKAPNGYLICDGSLVNKAVYPDLYVICGSLFGTETSTHFYLPDLRGKTVAGYNADDSTLNTIGKLLGSVSHTHTTGNHTLTIAEMPAHTHQDGKNDEGITAQTGGSTSAVMHWDSKSCELPTTSTGGGQAHNHGDTGAASSYQPTMVANWIVKAKILVPVTGVVENSLNSTSTVNALSAAQGKALNDKFSQYLLTSQVVDGLTSDSTTNALSANQGRLLNNTLHTINNHAHALRTGIYMQGTSGGALITFDNANLYNMMQVRLWGNGYGANPVDTIVQGYHYDSVGYFIQCKQHNNCANLGACVWKIINGKIALWVPYLVHYSSLVIDAYETLPSVRPIPTTVELMAGEPAGDASVACTIV